MSSNLTDQDYELLSDYLDGELTEDERLALEERLAHDVELRRELAYFRQTVALISQLPELQAPHDFTLDAKVVGPRVLPRPVVRRRINIGLLSAVAATSIVIIGAVVVLTLLSPNIGNVFSGVVNGLQSGGTGGAAPPANQVAQGPTPLPSPLSSMTLQGEGFTETDESQDDFNAASDSALEKLTASPTLVPSDGFTDDMAQEESVLQDTFTPEPTQKAASDPAPIGTFTPSATAMSGFLPDVAAGDGGTVVQTEPMAEMQLFSESPTELDTAAAIGRVETGIPPGAGGAVAPAMPAASTAIAPTPTETVISGALAAVQPTMTSNDESENMQRDRRDSLDFVSIIVGGTVIVTVGVIIFVLQRQTP